MQKKHFTITIAGAGGIGRAVGLMLVELADFDCTLYIGDQSLSTAREAAGWIEQGSDKPAEVQAFEIDPANNNESLIKAVAASHILLDCLPGSQAFRMGSLAHTYNKHYVNLTEHVEATNRLIELSKTSTSAFVLQAGLAPGFINILAHRLFKQFCKTHKVDQVDYVGMKVGALSQHAAAPHFYGFTWSTVGVATEYLKDAVVVKDYQKTSIPSLSENETIVIDGITYECNYTSGGAADLPEALAGKTKNLNYKTLRYPGHYKWVEGLLKNAPKAGDKIDYLEKEMKKVVPSVEDDVVIIHAMVNGPNSSGNLFQVEKAFSIKPVKIGKRTLRAIQSTTAAPMAECARMVLLGNYKGTVFQSHIDDETFMNGPFVKKIYFDKNQPVPKLQLQE